MGSKAYTADERKRLKRLEELAFYKGQWRSTPKLLYLACGSDPYCAILLGAILNKAFTIRWCNRDDKRTRTTRLADGGIDKSRIVTVAERVDRFYYSTVDIMHDTGLGERQQYYILGKLEKLKLITRRERGKLMKETRWNPRREMRIRWLRLANAFEAAHAQLLAMVDAYKEDAAERKSNTHPKLTVVWAEAETGSA